ASDSGIHLGQNRMIRHRRQPFSPAICPSIHTPGLGTAGFAAVVVAWGAGCSGGGSCATAACGGTSGSKVPLGIVLPADGDWVDSLATGPDGNVWFTDCRDSRIGKVTIGGEVTEYPTPSACIVSEGVDGIATGPDGNIWYTMWHSDVLGRVTPSGEITE